MRALLIAIVIVAVVLLVLGGLALRRGKVSGPWANRTERDSYTRDKPKGPDGMSGSL
jgi:FtsZ-interacting cell division protein ZipA